MIAAPLVTASLILFAGVIDDLRSRKVHNWLFLGCTALAVIVNFSIGGWSGLNTALLGFVAGFLILLPLVLLKIIGAGDMKLFAAFGAIAGWSAVINVAILSLIWGAIFGIVQVAVKGQLMVMVKNMLAIASMKKDRSTIELHKMPFTIAIFMGWLSFLVLQRGVL
jgi:prepilin peptidase CpaA